MKAFGYLDSFQYISWKLLAALKKAGVITENGTIIDPYNNPPIPKISVKEFMK